MYKSELLLTTALTTILFPSGDQAQAPTPFAPKLVSCRADSPSLSTIHSSGFGVVRSDQITTLVLSGDKAPGHSFRVVSENGVPVEKAPLTALFRSMRR